MAVSGSRSRCSRNGSPYSDDSERVLIIGDEDETLPLRMNFCNTLYKFKVYDHFYKLTILNFELENSETRLKIFSGKIAQTIFSFILGTQNVNKETKL